MADARAGDTVRVLAGTYFGPLQLKDGVQLESAVFRGATILAASPKIDVAVAATGIRGARFSGFRIVSTEQGSIQTAIQLLQSDVQLDGLEITGASVAGIEIGDGSRSILTGNWIHDQGGVGIYVHESAAPELIENQIVANGKAANAPKPGVEVREGARPALIRNVVAGNGAEPLPNVELWRPRNWFWRRREIPSGVNPVIHPPVPAEAKK
jgi:parallel beta-helix repeat protein